MSTKKTIILNNSKTKKKTEYSDFLTPCLSIGADVELKDIPTNGEEFLLKVIKEREKYKTVTKCDKDISKFARNQSLFAKEVPQAKVPEILKSTLEWQNIQVADFSDARMYLLRLTKNKSTLPESSYKIFIKDGRALGWKQFFMTKQPTLTYVIGLSQNPIDQGLKTLTQILDDVQPGETISHEIGQWIYTLLACTRQPLLSDTVSILRELARKCSQIRSNLNAEDFNVITAARPLNLVICLVARYFGQLDLAD